MTKELVGQAIGNIFSTTQLSFVPGLLISTLFLAVNPPNIMINPPTTDVLKVEYDFIIVGAGSAGSVVANRLSENSNFQVLLLEAGGNATEISEVPFFLGSLLRTELDWNYTLGPSSDFCLGMIDNTCFYPRGKVLGGSSTINYMFYSRGNEKDYDGWAKDGNYGWSFKEVLKYFKKSEDNTNPKHSRNRKFHSREGELTVSQLNWKTPLANIVLEAATQLGYYIGDYNAQNQTVFSLSQFTIRNGSRCSTNKAFLVPAGGRRNLDIATHAHVTKVLINPTTKRAYGVRFFKDGAYHEVFPRKEVVLSAGAANTPQLLMLSGIGPKDHLQELDIPVIKDLPVGFNVQDHIAISLTFITEEPVAFRTERYINLIANMSYDLFKNGPYSSNLEEVTGFLNSKFQDPKIGHPDLHFFMLSNSAASDGGGFREGRHLSDEHYDAFYRPIEDKESFTIIIVLLRPKSRGRIFIQSKDPFEKPILKLNFFYETEDILRLTDGAKLVLKFMDTKAFQNISARYHYAKIPLCPDAVPLSDEYFECLMKYDTYYFNHLCGSAKMGPENDLSAVVDPELRVKGVSGLRVVDASIMPKIISGSANAPTIMIGEKASDLIKNTWMKFYTL